MAGPLLFFLAAVFALSVSELILRILRKPEYYAVSETRKVRAWKRDFHQPSRVPGLDYELRPNANGTYNGIRIRINSFGMRGGEIALQKSLGQKRIVMLGDSFTFGLGVNVEDNYPQNLERLLREKFPSENFQVLNFGVSGYDTRDEAAELARKVEAFSPDLVVIGYCLNDPETSPIQPLKSYFHPPSWWQYSNLLSLLVITKEKLEIMLRSDNDYIRYLYQSPAKWNSTLQSFEEMGNWSRQNQVPILLVILPHLTRPGIDWPDHYRYRDLDQKVASAATRAGFQVLDLYPPFSRFPAQMLVISTKDPHYNPFGNRLAAEFIFNHLLENSPQLFK